MLLDKKDSDWALIEIDLSGLNRRDEKGMVIYSNDEGEDLYFIKASSFDAREI